MGANGTQKKIEIEDEKKLVAVYDRRLSAIIDGASLGDEYAGYTFKISGGSDKQGFPMHQGVGTAQRVRLLLNKGDSGFARGKRSGVRKRKSVRGCIVSPEIASLNLVVLKRGEAEIDGLTNRSIDKRLAPKRASKYRKMFALKKEDDARDYVIRRALPNKEGSDAKPTTKAPKLQRLVTPQTLQRKRRRLADKVSRSQKAKAERAAFEKLLAQRRTEKREALKSQRAARSVSVRK
eukprot:NODE_543_length_820_cov_54.242542_g482_i0.p1 GENE.NODE_543_length_820_cov_54.242542_g482_i0~~NODE_543_length_820_cov_54.242542_g482_i0.p1  ORF type:complete len:246 (+),score=102.56 NODE_543_length_820_cov_54.242542_g482_i0:32-739(+)